MHERPLAITALSVASVALGLYAMVAGMALLLGGSLGTFAGADAGVAYMVLGALLFGVGMTSFFVGYGFWSQRSWSWLGGLITAGVTIASMVAMGILGASYASLVLPLVLGFALIWFLLRPLVRTQLVTAATESTSATDAAAASTGSESAPSEEDPRGSGVAAEPGI